jgi:hypothetical protein
MGHPQSNQQTGFIGYPTNQIYNYEDQRYMLDTQRQFLDWGNWQPGMTRTNQFMADPGDNVGMQGQQDYAQNLLNEYYQRIGTPAEQSARQGYWQQMGGQNYGGTLPNSNASFLFPYNSPQAMNAGLTTPNLPNNDPWSQLNNMGISSAYGMPAWQQDYYGSQNAGPTGGQGDYGGQAPIEQFSSIPFPNSNYGVPNSFSPVTPNLSQQQNYSQQQAPAATPPSPWGNNNGSRGSPWGNPSNWGSQNYSGWGW